ncbi:hypothetical protein [Bradyrhizobium sp. Ai1a-2]|uniref:hypothetical protein n=1 Tax=Bradyrhizobium sp. Ai1a-2 TaxID=196490 RepID=UPI0004089442|nr:hypothetical protein [Bradyrhizobium sp. Ai1a-2]
MKKTIYVCDHSHREIDPDHDVLGVSCTISQPGREPITFGPIDLSQSCFMDAVRAARFAFTAAPAPAKPPVSQGGVGSLASAGSLHGHVEPLPSKTPESSLDEIARQINAHLSVDRPGKVGER